MFERQTQIETCPESCMGSACCDAVSMLVFLAFVKVGAVCLKGCGRKECRADPVTGATVTVRETWRHLQRHVGQSRVDRLSKTEGITWVCDKDSGGLHSENMVGNSSDGLLVCQYSFRETSQALVVRVQSGGRGVRSWFAMRRQ
jgi:hypothetical protein